MLRGEGLGKDKKKKDDGDKVIPNGVSGRNKKALKFCDSMPVQISV